MYRRYSTQYRALYRARAPGTPPRPPLPTVHSMDLHTALDQLPCAAAVRDADATLWSHPLGMRFLDGRVALPDALAKKVSSF